MVLLKSLPLIVLGIVSLILAALVIQRGYKKRVNLYFSLLALGVGGWVIGIAAYLLTDAPDLALTWARLYYFFPLIIGASMIFMAHLFPNKSTVPKPIAISVTIGFLLLSVPLLLDKNFLSSGIQVHEWGNEVILNTYPYIAYSIFISITFLEAMRIFYLKTRQLKGLYKAQARLLFLGICVSAVFGVLFNLILPGLGNYQLIHLGPLATNFFLIAIAYSIIKHRMFDIRLIIVRSSAYALSLGVIAVLYGILSYALSSAAFSHMRGSQLETIINVTLLIFVAITFAPLKRMFDRVTNKYFYRDAYDPQQFIDQLNRVAVTNVDVESLLNRSAEIVNNHLKTSFCSIELRPTAYNDQRILGDAQNFSAEDILAMRTLTAPIKKRVIVTDDLQESDPKLYRTLNKYDIGAVAKMSSSVDYGLEGIGLMLFGIKKSGNAFSEQDKRVLGIIDSELTIATQNALRFEEIENFSATLQDKVDDATKRLKRANDKLQQLDETKDEFISMASHQLRTPLTSVKGYVSMVLEGDAGPLNDMQKKLLEQSFISSQRMVFLIADLLNLSRLKTGKFIIENVPCNLADVIAGEVQQLKETAAGKNMTLVYNQPKKFPTFMLDETKIRQVIMNFVDNAIYYTPAGGKIEINLAEKAKSIEFTVKDNGIGVPQDEQHHLFNKFYRAKNAQKARPDGTGLGLFMAKKVIVAQGGALIFSSTVGKGSTFGFTFDKSKLVPAPVQTTQS